MYCKRINLNSAVEFPAPQKYPSVDLDISVVVDEHIQAGSLRQTMIDEARGFIRAVEVFDVYCSEQLGAQKKSACHPF